MIDLKRLGFCVLGALGIFAALSITGGSILLVMLVAHGLLPWPWAMPACSLIVGFVTAALYEAGYDRV